jgi:hypothetical protein
MIVHRDSYHAKGIESRRSTRYNGKKRNSSEIFYYGFQIFVAYFEYVYVLRGEQHFMAWVKVQHLENRGSVKKNKKVMSLVNG